MTILVLAGTQEARALCRMCSDLPLLASLSGATQSPLDLGVSTRIGGFGGAQGFLDFLLAQNIRAVLDATHPFAQMVHRTAGVCAQMSLPYLRLLRPAWCAEKHDTWIIVSNLAAARAALPKAGSIFLATGAGSEAAFAGISGPSLWLRRVDAVPHRPPWAHGGYIQGLPNADAKPEKILFEHLHITHVVAKNSGGRSGYGKVRAARQLRLPVIMVDRPTPPDVTTVETLDDAAAWLHAQTV